MIKLFLPWPPSVNTYWRSPPGTTPKISKQGRHYREAVFWCVRSQHRGIVWTNDERLSVLIEAIPPDRRKRDLDNLLKAPLDAIENSGLFSDDSQIDLLTIMRVPADKAEAGLVVVITEIEKHD